MGHPGSCTAGSSSKPYLGFADGERIDLAMGPNTVFSPRDALSGDIEAIECEYDNGNGQPGDPPSAAYCDGQTASGDWPFTVNRDGSFDYQVHNDGDLVAAFALPGKYFSLSAITCNGAHACVWYVGENYNSFSSPHVFSNPFYVSVPFTPGSSFPIWLVVVLVIAAALVVSGIYVRFVRPRRGVRARA